MYSSDIIDIFLRLVRLGLGKDAPKRVVVKTGSDWARLKALADMQGLTAVVLDALNTDGINLTDSMPQQAKLEWIGEVMQNYEQRFKAYENAISTLAGFYNQHGIKMMILKGYACSLDWPIPNHRPCGDIDIWQFGQWKVADTALKKKEGIKIDNGHHHHTIFDWKGFTVENHYDFLEVHSRRSNMEMERILKQLGQDDSYSTTVKGQSVYLPSPCLHALFLIRHLVAHFASANITLRQVLDWAFFVENHTKEIDWEWLLPLLKEYNMFDFYNVINAICVGDLGFDVKIFPTVQFDPTLKDRVLNDIFNPKYGAEEPKGFFKRLVYKYKRWQGNAWKQEMCFPDSRTSSFLIGLWAHIIKPAHL